MGELTKAQAQRLILDKKKVLEAKRKLYREGLPFLFGHKWYAWQRAFFNSKTKNSFVTAANQVGKSQSQIWKTMHWATDIEQWELLWPNSKPNLFWYLYPDADTVAQEFRAKWKHWLPQGDLAKSAQYGWKLDASKNEKEVHGIEWKSGVYMAFKTYSQNVHHLQAGTAHLIACDEELPVELWDELNQRRKAVQGYFSMVFTATRNQLMWKRVMEGKGPEELLPDAFKVQVSKYDCLLFDDGSPGLYTEEAIEQEIKECSSQTEVDRRVFGKFVTEQGRKYPEFDPTRHFKSPVDIPHTWPIYAGVDIGSGGGVNHPAAITFVAVRPDGRLGYVFKGWRGDHEVTTNGDIFKKFLEMRGSMQCAVQTYDWQAKDFETIATRNGESFTKAQKSHAIGEDTLNTLFKNDMLLIFDDLELTKLGTELMTLMKETVKTKAKDDFVDALRYTVTAIPWDWTYIQGMAPDGEKPALLAKPLTDKERIAQEIRERRGDYGPREENSAQEFSEEVDFWNDLYGS